MTNQQMWDEILVKAGFHLVDDIKEFAAKTCPPTLDNLFSIGVKALRERLRVKLINGKCKNSLDELVNAGLYYFLVNWVDQVALEGVHPAQALLEALHKCLIEV